jgi:hypothetical protein
MRRTSIILLGSALLALTATAASAQDDKRIHINFGGGPTIPSGDLGDRFSTGWGPAIGVTVETPSRRVGLQFEYAYRWMGLSDSVKEGAQVNPLLNATALDANHQTHQLDFNLVFNLTRPESPARVYAVAGPGAYYRKVEITRYEGTGVVCDPYFYVCGAYPVTSILGSRGGWDPGFNIGGGVGFKIAESAEFFVESRFHYVAGPKINQDPTVNPLPTTATSSTGGSTTGYYIPITFGFRF